MDPITTVAAINAALSLAESLLPQLAQLRTNGVITAEQQQAVLDRYKAFKAAGDSQFAGPEWQVDRPAGS